MRLTKKIKQQALSISLEFGYHSIQFYEFANSLLGKLGTEQYNKIHYIGREQNIDGIRVNY